MSDAFDHQHPKRLRWGVQRIQQIWRWQGTLGLAIRLLAALGIRIGGWYARDLDGSTSDQLPSPLSEGLTFRLLVETDADAYRNFRRGATLEQFTERLAAGNCCYAICEEATILSVTWVSENQGWMEYLKRNVQLAPDEIYIFDSFTAPNARGRHLQAMILARIHEQYLTAGYRRAGLFIGIENRSNIIARERMGYRRQGLIGHVRIGSFHKDFTWPLGNSAVP